MKTVYDDLPSSVAAAVNKIQVELDILQEQKWGVEWRLKEIKRRIRSLSTHLADLKAHLGTPTKPLASCDFCDSPEAHPPHNGSDGFHAAR